MKKIFDIEDYGAASDGIAINTGAIQGAIDACHAAGGGMVFCGPGQFLTGSLLLKSNVELHLAAGCRLVGSTRIEDYAGLQDEPWFCEEAAPEKSSLALIRAIEAENVSITGRGIIDGSGVVFYEPVVAGERFFRKPDKARPRMVVFYHCRHLLFEDTSFIDSPCWTFWLMRCQRVAIHRITICGDQRMINNDGIDVDGCRDVTISDCTLRTGDDCIAVRAMQRQYRTEEPAICRNIIVSNCLLDSWCQGVRIGCPGDGIIRDCTFSNLTISSRANGIVFNNPRRYLPAGSAGSADISRILFSQIAIDCAAMPVKIDVEAGIGLAHLGGISFSGFCIRSGQPCLVQGSPETIVSDISFSGMDIETSGEQALICQYCRNISLTDVRLSNRAAEN